MLRTRLMLGLLCLLIILLTMGLYSINQCSALGQRIQAISRDNDTAGLNLQQMKRSCAAMTGALLNLVTGDPRQSRDAFNKAGASFQEALDEERGRQSASRDEKDLISKLNDAYTSYSARANAFLQSKEMPDDNWRATAAKLGQNTADILDLADQLSLAHEHALEEGQKFSASDINDTIRLLSVLMILASVATLLAYIGLSHGLLTPLKTLTASIRQVGEGNLDQNVPVLSKDELGALARSFNQMAAQLRQYKANTSEELLRLTMMMHSTLASFPDPIFVLNSQGAVEFRNPEADRLAMKLLFAGVTRLPQVVDEKVEEVIANGQDYLPTLVRDAIKFNFDGQDRYLLPRIVLLRDDNQPVFGTAVILEDVTRMLLLDDVKTNLIATVSHELKTPLTGVRMALYLLHERNVGELNERQADLVATARDDADRLLRTLNDLLDLAKLEQGPSQLQLARVTPTDLIQGVVHDTREIAHAAGIGVNTDIAPNLPEVRVDRQRLAYVLTNLITNGVKYSPRGAQLTVSATLGQTRSFRQAVRFSVKDQGEGIAPEHQGHIFDRFYRVPGTTKSGAGLGLSIAREIVVAHQGEIGVISQPGQGSEFFIVLPLVTEEPASQS